MCLLPVLDPGLRRHLHWVPGTTQRRGIAQIQVAEGIQRHLMEERGRQNIDAFGNLAVPGAKHLRAQQTARAPISRKTKEKRLCARIIHFVIPGGYFDGQGVKTRREGFVIAQARAGNHQVAHFHHLRSQRACKGAHPIGADFRL